MLKNLLEEIKTYTSWEEANIWLATHGWGLGLIEEQKVLWDEFKKSGKDSAELVFDPIAMEIVIVVPVVVTEVIPEVPAVVTPAAAVKVAEPVAVAGK